MPQSDVPAWDAIVVGTGPGGATVARELARHGMRVLVLEQGSAAPLEGTLTQMGGMAAIPGKGMFVQRDASLLVQGITAGGSSALNFATAAPPPAAMFARTASTSPQRWPPCRQSFRSPPCPTSWWAPWRHASGKLRARPVSTGKNWPR